MALPRSVSGQVLEDEDDDWTGSSTSGTPSGSSSGSSAAMTSHPAGSAGRRRRRQGLDRGLHRLSRESRVKMRALDQKDKLFGRNDSFDCQVQYTFIIGSSWKT